MTATTTVVAYQIGKNRGTRLHLVANDRKTAWNKAQCGADVCTYGTTWDASKHGAGTCKKCLKGGHSFSRTNQVTTCEACGKRTTEAMSDAGNLCRPCFDAAGLENEHMDNGHAHSNGYVIGCPLCPSQNGAN